MGRLAEKPRRRGRLAMSAVSRSWNRRPQELPGSARGYGDPGAVRSHSFSAAPYPLLAGVEVWQRVAVRGSNRPPLVAALARQQAGEHRSPQRDVWCSTQLNTMRAHGIPSGCPSSAREADRARTSLGRPWQRLLGECLRVRLAGPPHAGMGPESRTEGFALTVDIQGLTCHAVPVSLAIEPPGRESLAWAPRFGAVDPRIYLSRAVLTSMSGADLRQRPAGRSDPVRAARDHARPRRPAITPGPGGPAITPGPAALRSHPVWRVDAQQPQSGPERGPGR
jgi:hypothetical protein